MGMNLKSIKKFNKRNFRPIFSITPHSFLIVCNEFNNEKTAWYYTRKLVDDIDLNINSFFEIITDCCRIYINTISNIEELKSYGIKIKE
jgi:hypothetical protein